MITSLPAPAKLTTRLRVTGVRADGYHLIDAEMVTLTLTDTIEIDPDSSGITTSGPFAAGVPLDATNLVSKALALARRTAAVHIHKRIPHGGGLGGGSADAAAVLRWVGWSDVAAATTLGADVAFCLVGGRAHVSGIGEVVTALPPHDADFTLVIPPLSCSTPAVYRMWDELGGPHAEGPNDLEPAALALEPQMRRWRDRIREAAGVPPTLAGSGSTWFVAGHRSDLVDALADATVVLTSTAGSPAGPAS